MRRLIGVGCLGLCGCFGLIDTTAAEDAAEIPPDAGVPADSAPNPYAPNPTPDQDCPPAQWDCSGVFVSCVERTQSTLPKMSVTEKCRCDFSRPTSVSDCGSHEMLLCGRLDVTDPEGRPIGLSCRCVSDSGWYCAQCPNLGLYRAGQIATTCSGPGHDFAECGCGG